MEQLTEIQQLLLDCQTDLLKAAKILYPEVFYAPFDPIHYQMRDHLQHPSRLTALAAPRGIGKTSLTNLVYPTVEALLGGARYIVPISATEALAVQQSENLKYQLTHNETIVKLFPNLKTREWSKEMWVIQTPEHDCCIFPRGGGQQIRGQNWRGFRPDRIIFDDLEKAKEMKNPAIRKERWEWVNADVLKAVDRRRRDWSIKYIGTVLHHDSILMKLVESTKWNSLVLEICNDKFESNAPHLYSDEDLKREYEQHKEDGILDVFYRELRNMPTPPREDAAFNSDHFLHYDPGTINFYKKGLEHLLILDPAKTDNPKSADSALVLVTLDLPAHKIYIRDIQRGKWHVDEILNRMGAMITGYGVDLVAIEVTGLNQWVMHPIKNYLRSEGIFAEIMELHAKGGVNEKGKIARIKTLIPYYRQGLIWHNPLVCTVLEGQLMTFPNSKLWDVMDAVGYIPFILEEGARYMEWHNDVPTGNEEAALEAEYAELYEDANDYINPRLMDGWRVL